MNLDDYDTVDELPAPPRKMIPAADHELLELAARALGAQFEEVDGEGYGNLHFPDGSVIYSWNPRRFSGDALELGAQLRIGTDHSKFCVHARDDHGNDLATVDIAGSDRVDATRLATLRAAAEVGRTIPDTRD